MKTLFAAWQDPVTRAWFPVGRVTYDGASWEFCYIVGAEVARLVGGFEPLPGLESFRAEYVSDAPFAFISNRVPSPSRSDCVQFLEWLDLPPSERDPIVILSRSGGRRETDTLELFPQPEPDSDGSCHLLFFARGLRHLPEQSIERVHRLKSGDRLLLAHDFQNAADPSALLLRTGTNGTCDQQIVGYLPRYLVRDVFDFCAAGRTASMLQSNVSTFRRLRRKCGCCAI